MVMAYVAPNAQENADVRWFCHGDASHKTPRTDQSGALVCAVTSLCLVDPKARAGTSPAKPLLALSRTILAIPHEHEQHD